MSIYKLALPCDCAGSCSIALITEIDWWNDDPSDFFVEFYTAVSRQRRFRDRLRVAWGALRNREPWIHDVSWTGPEEIRQLRDFLSKALEDPANARNGLDKP